MLKILNTGDLHLGRNYKNQPKQIAARYSEARIQALENVVSVADEENCDYIVIAGDLFDTRSVPIALIRQTCEILDRATCPVVVLPGNHDYYEGADDKFWAQFKSKAGTNITLLTENSPTEMDGVVFYPGICFNKRSATNEIGWIAEAEKARPELVHIGVAHGALEGLSYDKNMDYYHMTTAELNQCGMDLWLIGHTHIPFPTGEMINGQRIFNAGTHQQTDINDNSEGSVFVIEISDDKHITAVKKHTGVIQFCQRTLIVSHGQGLENAIQASLEDLDAVAGDTSVRLHISGTALKADYQRKAEIYQGFQSRYLKFEVMDSGLQPEITEEMVDSQTIEGSLENRLLKQFLDDPKTLNLAFDLVKQCQEG